MTFLLICVVQVSLLLSIALASLPLLRKKSAALRHCVLVTAIMFSILTPAFDVVMPAWEWSAIVSRHPAVAPVRERISAMTSPSTRVPAEPQTVPDRASGIASPRQADVPSVSGELRRFSLMIWVAGVIAGLIVLLTGLVRLAAVVSASLPMPNGHWRRLAASIASEYRLKGVVHLLESRNPSILVTYGAFSPR